MLCYQNGNDSSGSLQESKLESAVLSIVEIRTQGIPLQSLRVSNLLLTIYHPLLLSISINHKQSLTTANIHSSTRHHPQGYSDGLISFFESLNVFQRLYCTTEDSYNFWGHSSSSMKKKNNKKQRKENKTDKRFTLSKTI